MRFPLACSPGTMQRMPLLPLGRTTAHLPVVLAGTALGALLGCRSRPVAPAPAQAAQSTSASKETLAVPADVLLTGQAAMGDVATDAPGVRRLLSAADLRP